MGAEEGRKKQVVQKNGKVGMKTQGVKKALQESEERFRLLVDGVRDYGLLMLDPSGRVASWNAGAERIKGYRAEEIVGKDFSCFYTAEDIQSGKPGEELKIATAKGRFEDEGWRVRKDGSRFWANVIITALCDKAGNVRGFSKIARDITEKKQAEEELRGHREHLEELVQERTAELKKSQEIISRQAQEILDISTPVMQVWEGVLVAPLIGSLDSQRTQQFMEQLLNRIVDTNSSMTLVDITGVPTVDTQTAQHLIDTISAVRLLGAQVVLTGVRPAIAQTLVHLGVDLSDITTRSSLVAGLQVALNKLDLQVVNKKEA
jgi:PAS domain S-box-containing protein